MTVRTTPELLTLRQVFLPGAEAGRSEVPITTRIPSRLEIAGRVQKDVHLVLQAAHRSTVEGTVVTAVARVRQHALAAGRGRHPSVEGRARGTSSAEGKGRAADKRALLQPLQLLVVRRTSPLISREPHPTRRSPSCLATRSAGTAVPTVTSARKHIAR